MGLENIEKLLHPSRVRTIYSTIEGDIGRTLERAGLPIDEQKVHEIKDFVLAEISKAVQEGAKKNRIPAQVAQRAGINLEKEAENQIDPVLAEILILTAARVSTNDSSSPSVINFPGPQIDEIQYFANRAAEDASQGITNQEIAEDEKRFPRKNPNQRRKRKRKF